MVKHEIENIPTAELHSLKLAAIAKRFQLRNEFLENGPWVGQTATEVVEKRITLTNIIDEIDFELNRRELNRRDSEQRDG